MARPREEDVIRYDENGDPLKTPIYPDEVTEQWVTSGTNTPSTTPAAGTNTEPVATAPDAGTAAPATTPTTTPTMTYEEFLTQQRDDAYTTAETERERAEKAAETARQKQIIDANSAYQQSLATYGANAEAAASMGLTGSGYAEYLTGKAYATQRGEVASANRTAAALKEEAIYRENSAKDAADRIYSEGMMNWQESEKQKGENAYTSLSNMAAGGATLEQITNSADWSRLTPEQQTVISRTVSENTLMSRLDAGESLESLMLTDDWNALDDAGRTRVQNYFNQMGNSSYLSILGEVNNGLSIEDIESLPAWANLTEQQKNTLRGRAAYIQAAEAIENGLYDAESITTLPGYEHMSEADKAALNNQIAARDKDNAEKESAYDDENYRTVLGLIKTLPAESIRNLKAYKDIKNPELKAELDRLIEEQEKVRTKDTVDEHIDDVVSGDTKIEDLDVTPEIKAELKTQLTESISKAIKNGDLEGASSTVENAYKAGNISEEEYQTYNVDIWGKTIGLSVTDYNSLTENIEQIDAAVRAGEISAIDAENLKEYAKSQLAVVKSPEDVSSESVSYTRVGSVFANEKSALDYIAGETPAGGTIVYYNGKFFVFNARILGVGDYGWNTIKLTTNAEKFSENVKNELESNKSKAPTHKADTTTSGPVLYKPNSSNTGNTNIYGPMKP